MAPIIEGLKSTAGARFLWLHAPGILVCFTIATVAQLVAELSRVPAMLTALVLGFAFHFVSKDAVFDLGTDFAAKRMLRIGIALLGMRITFDNVLDVGMDSIIWVSHAVFLTLLFGLMAARFFRVSQEFGLLSSGAVAICGASAALAISAVLPPGERSERNTLVVVIAVSALSTIAMVVYPALAIMLGLSDEAAGMFLGGSIHDVAQVVGAGYSLSTEIGDLATITKLSRVVMLAPLVFLVIWGYRGEGDQKSPTPLPMFLVVFCFLVAIGSFGIIPDGLRLSLIDVSGWCLTAAVAGLGVKTSFSSLASIGILPIGLIVMETIVMGLWILLGAWILR